MRFIATCTCCALLTAATAFAGPVKSYQVSGPVLEVKDDLIVVQKGNEKWEIARDKDTKVTGDLKPGSKATVKYTMKATTVDVKPEGKATTPKKK
jgi:hypothetical protein